jgi:hypothetical protein
MELAGIASATDGLKVRGPAWQPREFVGSAPGWIRTSTSGLAGTVLFPIELRGQAQREGESPAPPPAYKVILGAFRQRPPCL